MAAKAGQAVFRDALLARTCARNAPIEITVAGRGMRAPLKSRFLEGPETAYGAILIEVPTQAGRPYPLQPKDVVDVTLVAEGQRYGFRSAVWNRTRASLAGGNTVAAIAIGCPNTVIQLQRRRYYRVRIPAQQPIVVECVGKEPEAAGMEKGALAKFESRVIDISAGGMCLRIPKENSFFATPRTRLALIFKIGISRKFKLISEVRYAKELPGGAWSAGVEFVNPDRTLAERRAVDSITRYVARRQREELKKKSGLE